MTQNGGMLIILTCSQIVKDTAQPDRIEDFLWVPLAATCLWLMTAVIIIIIKFVIIFTKTLINNIYNMLQDNTRDWNVEQDIRPN